jgi:hypothetical protein
VRAGRAAFAGRGGLTGLATCAGCGARAARAARAAWAFAARAPFAGRAGLAGPAVAAAGPEPDGDSKWPVLRLMLRRMVSTRRSPSPGLPGRISDSGIPPSRALAAVAQASHAPATANVHTYLVVVFIVRQLLPMRGMN